jgi:hypothetical protein
MVRMVTLLLLNWECCISHKCIDCYKLKISGKLNCLIETESSLYEIEEQ